MKTAKEIQTAASNFLQAFKEHKVSELEGTFIAYDPIYLYKQNQFYLSSAIAISLLFSFLVYNAWYIDAVYYWHIDGPVIIGVLTIVAFLGLALLLISKFLSTSKQIQFILLHPQEHPYGVLITEEYYFENTPKEYHIIPRENIVKVDYEERQKNNKIYVELLLDMGDHHEVRGIHYQEEEFDFKSWINQ